jgi:hypothetical protein
MEKRLNVGKLLKDIIFWGVLFWGTLTGIYVTLVMTLVFKILTNKPFYDLLVTNAKYHIPCFMIGGIAFGFMLYRSGVKPDWRLAMPWNWSSNRQSVLRQYGNGGPS